MIFRNWCFPEYNSSMKDELPESLPPPGSRDYGYVKKITKPTPAPITIYPLLFGQHFLPTG